MPKQTKQQEFLDYLTDPRKAELFKAFYDVGDALEYVVGIKYLESESNRTDGRFFYITYEIDSNTYDQEIGEMFSVVTRLILAKRVKIVEYLCMPYMHDHAVIHGSIVIVP